MNALQAYEAQNWTRCWIPIQTSDFATPHDTGFEPLLLPVLCKSYKKKTVWFRSFQLWSSLSRVCSYLDLRFNGFTFLGPRASTYRRRISYLYFSILADLFGAFWCLLLIPVCNVCTVIWAIRRNGSVFWSIRTWSVKLEYRNKVRTTRFFEQTRFATRRSSFSKIGLRSQLLAWFPSSPSYILHLCKAPVIQVWARRCTRSNVPAT